MGGDCRRDDRNTPAARGVQHRQEHGWTVEARASAASGDDEGGPRHLPSEVMGFLGHDHLEGRGLWRAATERSECCNGRLLALAAGGATGKQWDESLPSQPTGAALDRALPEQSRRALGSRAAAASMQYVGQGLTDFDGGGQFGKHWGCGYELTHRKRIAGDNNEGNVQACEEFDNRHARAVAEMVIDDCRIDVVCAKVGECALIARLDRVCGAKAAEPKVVVGGDDGIVLDHEDLLAVEIGTLIPRIAIAI